jgi:hypothetical protein
MARPKVPPAHEAIAGILAEGEIRDGTLEVLDQVDHGPKR